MPGGVEKLDIAELHKAIHSSYGPSAVVGQLLRHNLKLRHTRIIGPSPWCIEWLTAYRGCVHTPGSMIHVLHFGPLINTVEVAAERLMYVGEPLPPW